MVKGLWGKKIGMTQIFTEEKKVVPVTAIDIADWYVTQLKTNETDGYTAVKLGCVKSKYTSQEFSLDWLKKPRIYFSSFKEVPVEDISSLVVGQPVDINVLSQGDLVDVFGISKGAGFQGVVKRHGFSGGPASHGAVFGRFPGSLGGARKQGKVAKGKKMPGHMGATRQVMQKLKVMQVKPDANVIFVKGSIPGKAGSLVFVRKCR